MTSEKSYRDYGFPDAEASHMHRLFMPAVLLLMGDIGPGTGLLDVGCRNSSVCGEFLKRGCDVVGIDLSEQGIEIARAQFPGGRFEVLEAGGDILESLDEKPFDSVASTEVVEHLYAPGAWARGCYTALKSGSRLVGTTPYHGHLKNLMRSVCGKWDTHANLLRDGGHIKLWSRRTISSLLEEAGFKDLRFRGLGRMPLLWMTMRVAAVRPLDT